MSFRWYVVVALLYDDTTFPVDSHLASFWMWESRDNRNKLYVHSSRVFPSVLRVTDIKMMSSSPRTLTVPKLPRRCSGNLWRKSRTLGPRVVDGASGSRSKCSWGTPIMDVEHAWLGMARSEAYASESVCDHEREMGLCGDVEGRLDFTGSGHGCTSRKSRYRSASLCPKNLATPILRQLRPTPTPIWPYVNETPLLFYPRPFANFLVGLTDRYKTSSIERKGADLKFGTWLTAATL